MNSSQFHTVSSEIVPDLTASCRTDKLCLILFRRQSVSGKVGQQSRHRAVDPMAFSEPDFIFQTGIHSDHIHAYRTQLFRSDPHIQNALQVLNRNQSQGDWLHLEDSKPREKIQYGRYLLKIGIYQTATYTRRITNNSYLVVGMLSSQRKDRIRLEESSTYLSQWLDYYCDDLIENGLRSRFLESDLHLGAGELLAKLTPREREVIQVLSRGCSNKQIASELKLSENTIENHLRNIYRKFNVHNRTTLVASIGRF